MIKTTKEKITVYKSEKIVPFNKVTHFFSTREGGVSTGIFHSLNFGTHYGEAENMAKNLLLLKNSIECSNYRFILPIQTHSDVVAVVDQLNCDESFDNTDALITNLTKVIIVIKTADCVPILLIDPIRRVVGAVHAGWRGTAYNIAGKAIDKMKQVFGSNPSDIIAAIGPCISQKKYEVGREVTDAIGSLLKSTEKVILKRDNQPDLVNLTKANFQLLCSAGLDKENIDSFNLCTYTNKDEFFSARRDGSKTGRMINGIGIMA